MEGVVVLQGTVYGYVLFTQLNDKVKITVDLFRTFQEKAESKHGFHIHASGDLRRGCDSCCSHYNPSGQKHGGLENGHAGDLGNIVFDTKGNCKMVLYTSKFTVQEIIGRSIVIHQFEDDLGLGGNEESEKTGNSGKRICCAIIGYSENSCKI